MKGLGYKELERVLIIRGKIFLTTYELLE